jgi:hypothetical protein
MPRVCHNATPLQVSVNIGSVPASNVRHGRPFRAIAAFTASVARSDARIWKGAPPQPAQREGYSSSAKGTLGLHGAALMVA